MHLEASWLGAGAADASGSCRGGLHCACLSGPIHIKVPSLSNCVILNDVLSDGQKKREKSFPSILNVEVWCYKKPGRTGKDGKVQCLRAGLDSHSSGLTK